MDNKEATEVDIGDIAEQLSKHAGGWKMTVIMARLDSWAKVVGKFLRRRKVLSAQGGGSRERLVVD